MSFFSRLRIRSKVILAFAVVLLGTVALGLFARERLQVVDGAAAELRNNQLPSTRLLGELALAVQRFRQIEGALLLAPKGEAREAEIALLKSSQARIDELMARYEPMVDPGEERRLADAAKAALATYDVEHRKLLEFDRRDDEAAASAFYRGEQRAGMRTMQGVLQQLIDYNVRQANAVAERGSRLGSSAQTWILLTLAAMLSLCAAAGWSLIAGISTPITSLTASMRRLAAHDFKAEIPGAGRGDEIGEMSAALRVFRDAMEEADRLAAGQAADRAAKQRRQDAMDRHTQDFGVSISGVMEGLAASAESMRKAAQSMSTAATTVHDEASGTADGTESTAHQLTSVAAAIEQLTSSVAEISRQVSTASGVAREAVHRADTSQTTMKDLAEATVRIGNVVALIQDIAGQTNLLALNATIEAARAGEAGKGFAVVANEVKKLAGQTAKATSEIGDQIQAVRTAADGSVGAMAEVAQIVRQMNEISGAIAAAVEEQSATTRTIAGNLQTVSAAGRQASAAMQRVVSVADQAGSSSRQVLAAAGSIGEEAGRLRTEVDQFLAAVRDESGDRRRYERIPGNGAMARVTAAGHAAAPFTIQDISRGGVAVNCTWTLPPGAEATVELPGLGRPVGCRVVRSGSGGLALVFRQDPATLELVDRALAGFTPARRAA
ncbi:HAMP domain-containing protein [Rhodovastum atsumiense]|uniref:HAMP domain-containing protein n=1 Tax=Rhodovastum atsumiense TaxID=504468 RepID=A0A5M6ILQ4_9PROT|nr:methyl-accepting chemotaxis protein [Rhodovastum atsumiense]KAA5609184.1 HAMP domain-containing protein [Rhodovastum atsumiense]CAH2602816.1 HAMP domain-containing protein [Rhodovastum atsumiense]